MPEELVLDTCDVSDDNDFAPYIKLEETAAAAKHSAATKIQSNVRGRKGRKAAAQKRAANAPVLQPVATEELEESSSPEVPVISEEPVVEDVDTELITPTVDDPALLPEVEQVAIPEEPVDEAAMPVEPQVDTQQQSEVTAVGDVLAPEVMETTLAMIKPDAVAAGVAEAIISDIEAAGFKITKKKCYQLTSKQAQAFYAEHEGKSFFNKLVEFMSSGPIWALALEKVGAILAWRALMGPTNSTKAKEDAPNSLRAKYGTGIISLLLLRYFPTVYGRHVDDANTVWHGYHQCCRFSRHIA